MWERDDRQKDDMENADDVDDLSTEGGKVKDISRKMTQ